MIISASHIRQEISHCLEYLNVTLTRRGLEYTLEILLKHCQNVVRHSAVVETTHDQETDIFLLFAQLVDR